jgi:hypothetical protein
MAHITSLVSSTRLSLSILKVHIRLVSKPTNTPAQHDSAGPALYLYGASGPDYGSYEISIDGGSVILSAYASTNASNPHLLYSNSSLPYANHTLKVTNLGAQNGDQGAGNFLFDYLLATTEIAPSG